MNGFDLLIRLNCTKVKLYLKKKNLSDALKKLYTDKKKIKQPNKMHEE